MMMKRATGHLFHTQFAFLLLSCMCCSTAWATTISVNTLADELNSDGDCGLREAIRAANTNLAVDACPAGSGADVDTIQLQNGVTYGLSRVGLDDTAINGDLDITDHLIIIGNDATVDGNGGTTSDRVFEVLSDQVVEISDLTITDGSGIEGGSGLVNSGSVTLKGVTVTANSSTGLGGGGLFNESGNMILSNTTVSNNSAPINGGGIAVANGTLTADHLTVSGNTVASLNVGGVFIFSNASAALTDSIISGNHASDSGGGMRNLGSTELVRTVVSGNSAGGDGGGIYNIGVLEMTDCTITANTADDSGGLINDGGTLTMRGSTIRGNSAISAGGFRNSNSGIARLVNSTISSNSASAGAGGVANGSSATLELSNVTIAFNTADSDANNSGDGGGLNNAATVVARNTLIGENIDASASGTIFPDCSGGFTSAGNNLIENTTGCTIGGVLTGNITGTDPGLLPLANNGGPTQTNAFPSGAAPQDAGKAAGCVDDANVPITTDQRGTARAQPTRCDIGAYEFEETEPTVLSITRMDPSPTSAPSVRFSVLFSESVTGVTLSRFAVQASGVSGAAAFNVVGSGADYVVVVSTGTGDGTLRLNLATKGSVRDLALNPLAAIFTAGEEYTMNRALPIFANGFE